jgi:glycerol-3-phosphate dehydrogenase
MAPRVAELLARELGHDATWQSGQVSKFTELAKGYQVASA